jgi:hypothetical protein
VAAQRPGWFVKGRVALLILFEIANHPVCAAKERGLLLMAQRPLKGGDWAAANIFDTSNLI